MSEENGLIQLDNELLNTYVESLGSHTVKKMFDLYSQQVAIYLKDIENSLLCGSDKLWQEHCHKMKGAAGSVGLTALHSRLVLMEKTKANNSDKANQLAKLNEHNQQAMVDFKHWLESL